MHKLVLLRHGESRLEPREPLHRLDRRGPLAEAGVEEARAAGQLLKAEGSRFDLAFTSVLKRAIRTLWIALDEMDLMWIPVEKSWRLNERHYGALQGLNKAETAAKFGEQQVLVWRRSYDTPPPALEPERPALRGKRPALRRRPTVPLTECLKDTVARVVPYWDSDHRSGGARRQARDRSPRTATRCARWSSTWTASPTRTIVELNIPTGIPLVYELDDDLKPLKHYYLGDPEEVARRVAAVAARERPRPDGAPFFLAPRLVAAPRCGRRRGKRISRRCAPDRRADAQSCRRSEASQREARDALRASERAISEANRSLAALEAEGAAAARGVRAPRGAAPRAASAAREREAAIERMLLARSCRRRARHAARGAVRRRSRRPRARLHYVGYVSRAAAALSAPTARRRGDRAPGPRSARRAPTGCAAIERRAAPTARRCSRSAGSASACSIALGARDPREPAGDQGAARRRGAPRPPGREIGRIVARRVADAAAECPESRSPRCAASCGCRCAGN